MGEVKGKLNLRQEEVLWRMFQAGPEGFFGGLSAANNMTITGSPTATATRDLGGLVEAGALPRSGQQKSTRYRLNVTTGPIATVEGADIVKRRSE